MQLIQIDAFDPEPTKAVVTLLRDVVFARRLLGRVDVDAETKLGEDVRATRRRKRLDRAPNDFFRMSGTVNRRRVDPIHAVIDRCVNRLDARAIVLAAPLPSADGPAAQANRGDVEITLSE